MVRDGTSMLAFDKVSFQHKGAADPIIKDLSFEIKEGEFISIIGASGCGKSTILRLISGLEQSSAGTISINGTPIQQLKNYSAYMPQKDLLFPWKNVEGNVMIPMTIQGLSKEKRTERAEKMLDLVGLKQVSKRYPRELSGGMRQRVSFARTLCVGADLLLLDEPFSALDYLNRISLQEWLAAQWSKVKSTVLLVTHDVEEALFLSTRILVIEENPIGKVTSVDVPLQYPRTRDMLMHPDIMELKEKMIRSLRQEESKL